MAIDIQLAPLHELMASLRGTVPPDPGSVSEWANRRTAIKRAAEQAAAGGRPGGARLGRVGIIDPALELLVHEAAGVLRSHMLLSAPYCLCRLKQAPARFELG